MHCIHMSCSLLVCIETLKHMKWIHFFWNKLLTCRVQQLPMRVSSKQVFLSMCWKCAGLSLLWWLHKKPIVAVWSLLCVVLWRCVWRQKVCSGVNGMLRLYIPTVCLHSRKHNEIFKTTVAALSYDVKRCVHPAPLVIPCSLQRALVFNHLHSSRDSLPPVTGHTNYAILHSQTRTCGFLTSSSV